MFHRLRFPFLYSHFEYINISLISRRRRFPSLLVDSPLVKEFVSSGVPFRPRRAGPGGGARRAVSVSSLGGFWGGLLGYFEGLFLT